MRKSPSVIIDENFAQEELPEKTLLAEIPIEDDDNSASFKFPPGTVSFRHDLCPEVPLLEDLDKSFAKDHRVELWNVPQVKFNLRKLLEVVCHTKKQCSWCKITLIGYGIRNKVYLVTFPNGEEAVARIPFMRNFSVNRLKSEVGAMLYAKAKLPPESARLIPTVYTWSSDPTNEVEAPYIMMEKMQGSPLADLSRTMTFEQRLSVTLQLAYFAHALHGIGSEFDKMGGIYFENECFSVGPLVRRNEQKAPLEIFAGPWGSTSEYFVSQIHQLLIQWQAELYPKLDALANFSGTNVFDVLRFLADLLVLIPILDPGADSPQSLVHTDLHENNIFIDPKSGKLSAILDWESAGIFSESCATRVPRCLQSPDVFSVHSKFQPYDEDAWQDHIETTKLRNHYIIARGGLEPGYIERFQKSVDLHSLDDYLVELGILRWGYISCLTDWVEAKKKKEEYQLPVW